MKIYLKADDGKLVKVLEYDSGSRIEIPIDRNGNVKWFDDGLLIKKAN